MHRLSDVQDDDAESKPGQIVVRGTVWIWGDTIEHEYGIKGEYGYPDRITGVHCVACPGWLPVEIYTDESTPPIHTTCRTRGFMVLEEWRPAGLANLRMGAPQWFGTAGNFQRLSSIEGV